MAGYPALTTSLVCIESRTYKSDNRNLITQKASGKKENIKDTHSSVWMTKINF